MQAIKHRIITQEVEADIHVRNEARREAAIRALGDRYVCHPVNRIERVRTQRDTRISFTVGPA